MSRTRRTRSTRALAVTIGAVALTGAVLTGCGAGQTAQTSEQMPAVNGAGGQTSQGDVQIRGAQIAYPQSPAAPDALYQRGGSAPLTVTLINVAPVADRLVRVSSPFATGATITGDPTLPQNVALAAGGVAGTGAAAPRGNRSLVITLTGLTQPIRSGLAVPVTLTFERAGSVTVRFPTSPPAEGTGEPERVDSEAEGAEQPAPAEPGTAPAGAPEAPAPAPAAGAPAAPAPEGGR